MSSPEAAMPDTEQATAYCRYRPAVGELRTMCPQCGHAAALHIGVEDCPVCELVHHNQRMRAAMAANRIEVHVTGVDTRTLERAIERINLRIRGSNRFRR